MKVEWKWGEKIVSESYSEMKIFFWLNWKYSENGVEKNFEWNYIINPLGLWFLYLDKKLLKTMYKTVCFKKLKFSTKNFITLLKKIILKIRTFI